MLVSEAKTLLKRYGFDDEDPLLPWLNAGLHEFEAAADWIFLQSSVNVTVAAGGAISPFAFFKIHSIRDTTNKNKLQGIDLTRWERDITDPTLTGKPSLYTVLKDDTVWIYPVPDTAVTFRIVYQSALSDLVDDAATLPGPPVCHHAVVRAAAYIALESENEEQRATTAMAQFEADVMRLRGKMTFNQLDEPRQVVDSQGYGGGGDGWQ